MPTDDPAADALAFEQSIAASMQAVDAAELATAQAELEQARTVALGDNAAILAALPEGWRPPGLEDMAPLEAQKAIAWAKGLMDATPLASGAMAGSSGGGARMFPANPEAERFAEKHGLDLVWVTTHLKKFNGSAQ